MNFIITIIFWFMGVVVGSFTLIPSIIILVFGIPTTRKLEKMGVLKKNSGIVSRYLVSLVILPTIILMAAIIVFLFIRSGFVGFLVGVGMALFLGLGKTGKNKNNISDYIETNKQHFTTSLEEATLAIAQY